MFYHLVPFILLKSLFCIGGFEIFGTGLPALRYFRYTKKREEVIVTLHGLRNEISKVVIS